VKCDQQTQTLVESPKPLDDSVLRESHKRSSSLNDQDTNYQPSKKKRKRKIKSTSSVTMSSDSSANVTNGYALKIRNKFLYTHLQSFLQSQKFIKSKLDIMKEAMKSCNSDMSKLMNRIVPQFEGMYNTTIKLANLEQSDNETELFSCITELSDMFPSLITVFSESLSLKVPGVSLTILSVLRKMESLAIEMSKYVPQSETLAYGDATTGETTSMESSISSSSSDCDVAKSTSPPPLLSLDEAVEMLDKGNDDRLQCLSPLTVSISTELLCSVGGLKLSHASDGNADETDNGDVTGDGDTNRDQAKNEDHTTKEDQETTAVIVGPENFLSDAIVHEEKNDPVTIEVIENEHQMTTKSDAGATAGADGEVNNSSDLHCNEDIVTDVSDLPNQCIAAPPITSISRTNVATNTCSTNPNNEALSNSQTCTTSVVSVQSSAPPTYYNALPNQCIVAPPVTSLNQTNVATHTCSTNQNTNNSQICTTSVVPVSSAPPSYNNVGYSPNQPHSSTANNAGTFTPLLPTPHIPIPIINIGQSVDGLVVKWTLEQLDFHLASQVHSYCLCVFQGVHAPAPDLWHTIGEVQAMRLPMACTLKCFEKGKTYHFAVQAVSRDGVRGQFSKSKIIQIY